MTSSRWVIVAAFMGLSIACQTRPIPLSAQQGSTVVIPLDYTTSAVGYGSTSGGVNDAQRGSLWWTLDAPWPGGTDLTTRFTTVLAAPPSAGIWDASLTRQALLSLVDIPADAPLGLHDLYVVREDGSAVEDPVVGGYHGQIAVLPNEIVVAGEPNPIVGTPSNGFDPLFETAMPQPAVRLVLSGSAWSGELELRFDPTLLEVTGVVAGDGHGTGAWLRRTQPDTVEVSAIGLERQFKNLVLLFRPVGAPVDLATEPDAVQILQARFTDAAGIPVSLNVSIAGIE